MARSSNCCSPCQDLHDGKDKLANGIPTKESGRRTPASAASRTSTPAVALGVAPLAAFGSANSSVVRYLEDDLQRILKTILDFKHPASVPASVVATAPHYEGPHKRPLKAWFPDIYWSKIHLECNNFFQECKNHFAITNTLDQNQVPFAATFLKDITLFHWQQYQCKIEDQTNIPISWEGFKAFLCQSLSKSEAFVDTIWSTIRKKSQHLLEEVMDWPAHLEHL